MNPPKSRSLGTPKDSGRRGLFRPQMDAMKKTGGFGGWLPRHPVINAQNDTGKNWTLRKGGFIELTGKRIALLIEDMYNEFEFWYPYYRMKEAGARVTVVGTGAKEYHSKACLTAPGGTPAEFVKAAVF